MTTKLIEPNLGNSILRRHSPEVTGTNSISYFWLVFFKFTFCYFFNTFSLHREKNMTNLLNCLVREVSLNKAVVLAQLAEWSLPTSLDPGFQNQSSEFLNNVNLLLAI